VRAWGSGGRRQLGPHYSDLICQHIRRPMVQLFSRGGSAREKAWLMRARPDVFHNWRRQPLGYPSKAKSDQGPTART
jgi:hypothetical protein